MKRNIANTIKCLIVNLKEQFTDRNGVQLEHVGDIAILNPDDYEELKQQLNK